MLPSWVEKEQSQRIAEKPEARAVVSRVASAVAASVTIPAAAWMDMAPRSPVETVSRGLALNWVSLSRFNIFSSHWFSSVNASTARDLISFLLR